jgi:NADH:ubiquinone oxidoreductase subunit 6 (subunit J)
MTVSDSMFWVFAAIAVLPAAAILFIRGIVRMAFLLLFSLAGFAGLYLQLGAGFLGFTQVVVYIGGILILFLFGVMLTSRMDVPVREKVGLSLLIPGVIAGLLLMGALLFIAIGNPWKDRAPVVAAPAAAAPASPGPATHADPQTADIGLKLLGGYVLPFEAVSVLLLAAMVGATYIARARAEGQEGGPAS